MNYSLESAILASSVGTSDLDKGLLGRRLVKKTGLGPPKESWSEDFVGSTFGSKDCLF